VRRARCGGRGIRTPGDGVATAPTVFKTPPTPACTRAFAQLTGPFPPCPSRPMAIRALACPIDGARTVEGGGHLGVTAVNGSGVVAGGDAGVSVTEAGGSGHDPMPFRDPGGMRRPERVRSEARHASSAGSWVEVGLTPGRVVQRAPRPLRGEQQCVRRGQLPEQRPERLDDEAGQNSQESPSPRRGRSHP
jgi:hypothetical protein